MILCKTINRYHVGSIIAYCVLADCQPYLKQGRLAFKYLTVAGYTKLMVVKKGC
jgi:hypothetical protein